MIFFHQARNGSGGARLVLSGEIDLSVRDELRTVLAADVMDVDLHDVTFLDCSGVGEFVRAYVSASGRGHALTVGRPQGMVRKVLELTGVLALLTPDDVAGVPAAPQR